MEITLEAQHRVWKGRTIDLSPYGVKITSLAKSVHLVPSMRVQLRFAPDDQELCLAASVVRTDPDGVALHFDPLKERQFQRLKAVVDTFLQLEWQKLLRPLDFR